MDSTAIFLRLHDTIYMVVQGINIAGAHNTQGGFDWKTVIPSILIGALTGLIAGGVAYWSKRQDLKTFQENMELQKKIFDQNKKQTESALKAELEKLENLAEEYKLSLKKFDYEQIDKILDFGNDKNEKISMIKEFSTILKKYKYNRPYWIEDSEYDLETHKEGVALDIYPKLGEIQKDIENLLANHIATFSYLHEKFTKVAIDANNIEREILQLNDGRYDNISEPQLILNWFREKLYDLYNHLFDLSYTMKSEINELGIAKQAIIKEQFEKRPK